MEKERKEAIEVAFRQLNSTLRTQCVDTKLITIEQWNEEIAPKLSALAMTVEGAVITARTYKLPENYFDDYQPPPNNK